MFLFVYFVFTCFVLHTYICLIIVTRWGGLGGIEDS